MMKKSVLMFFGVLLSGCSAGNSFFSLPWQGGEDEFLADSNGKYIEVVYPAGKQNEKGIAMGRGQGPFWEQTIIIG